LCRNGEWRQYGDLPGLVNDQTAQSSGKSLLLAVQYDILDNAKRVRCSLLYTVTLCPLLYTLAGNLLGNVQALPGHSSPEVRPQIYLRAIPAQQRRAVEKLETFLLNPMDRI
jgi:hypothetical protein